jgi:filamentous hemagglutinin family protein
MRNSVSRPAIAGSSSCLPKSRTKLLALAVATCFTSGSYALPTDPTVAAGNATFNQVGKVLNVTNSNGAIINWNTFSIGAGETTRFIQTSASSSVLNRVLSNDPSLIYGTLSSNGRVWLVNPAGIMVGAGGRVDVAGFVASTLNIRNEDFLAGKNLFQNTPGAGSVINQGTITTPSGGSVYLIAPNVTNEGIIHSPNGEVILAAGQTVSLIDSATPASRWTSPAPKAMSPTSAASSPKPGASAWPVCW